MKTTFSGLEMLKIAIKMEEEGGSFYLEAAKHTQGKVKDFFTFAAGQEFLHKNTFSTMYDDLQDKKAFQDDYLFDPEVSGYLNALIENTVFNAKDQAAASFSDLKSAAAHALAAETRTVEVYKKMYEGITSGEAKEIFSGIIKEEEEHVVYFQNLLDEITA